MKKRIRALIATIFLLVICFGFATCVEAGTRMVWIGSRTGWVKINGGIYYIHETRGYTYNRGEPCQNDYRWKGNKLYYFGRDGQMIKHSTMLIKLKRDHSVKYIYTPGDKNKRYNATCKRYERKGKSGKWYECGMQTDIYWMCDWQK